MQAGDVLHHQRVTSPWVAVPLGRDPPHLHLADPVFDHDSPLRQPPVPGFLPGRQATLPGTPRRRVQPRPQVHRVPGSWHPVGVTTPRRSYTYLSCVLPGNAPDTAAIRTRRRPLRPGVFRFRTTTATWCLIVCGRFFPE